MATATQFSDAIQASNLNDAEKFLSVLRGSRIFIPHLRGNNGDRLLEMAMESQCVDYSLRTVLLPQWAEWICFRGNGAMNDFWCDGLDLLGNLSKRFPDKPIAVLPSSFHFTTTNLGDLLAGRTAPTMLFARERKSFELLSSLDLPGDVSIGLDDDTALRLGNDPVVQRWRKHRETQPKDYVLVVERADLEHHGSSAPLGRMDSYLSTEAKWKALARYYLGPTRDALRRRKWREKGIWGCEPLTPEFEAECRSFLETCFPKESKLPWKTGDVSLPLRYSFDEFCELIAGAAVVVTNRLHAGIMAHFLGIPVGFRDGRYGKIRGIFELSLAGKPGMHLFEEGKPVVLDDSPKPTSASEPD